MDNYTLRCREIIKKYYPMISMDSNILGIGMGFKTINNITTNVPCLKVYVAHKISQNSCPKNKIIPRIFNGVITDVVASGESKDYSNIAMQNYNIKPNAELTIPARGGELIYNKGAQGPVGTLACAITEKQTQGEGIHILSTARVISGNNKSANANFIFQKADTLPNGKSKILARQNGESDLILVPKGTQLSNNPAAINKTDASYAYVESTKIDQNKDDEDYDKYKFKEESQLIVSGGMFDKKQIDFPKDLTEILQKKGERNLYMLSKHSGERSGSIENKTFSGVIQVEDKRAYFIEQYLIDMQGVQPYDYGALVFVKPNKASNKPLNKHIVLGMIIGHCGDIESGKIIVTPIDPILNKLKMFIYYYRDQKPLG